MRVVAAGRLLENCMLFASELTDSAWIHVAQRVSSGLANPYRTASGEKTPIVLVLCDLQS